jgi:hypothetical protein
LHLHRLVVGWTAGVSEQTLSRLLASHTRSGCSARLHSHRTCRCCSQSRRL